MLKVDDFQLYIASDVGRLTENVYLLIIERFKTLKNAHWILIILNTWQLIVICKPIKILYEVQVLKLQIIYHRRTKFIKYTGRFLYLYHLKRLCFDPPIHI